MHTVSLCTNRPISAAEVVAAEGKWGKPELFKDASLVFVIPEHPSLCGPSWLGGEFSLSIRSTTNYNYSLARCNITNFTNNCGIRAVGSFSSGFKDFKELMCLFMNGLEDYLFNCAYSVAVGSDGTSSGAFSVTFIQNFGTGWRVEPLGNNRRMNRSDLSLYWKYLQPYGIANWSTPIA